MAIQNRKRPELTFVSIDVCGRWVKIRGSNFLERGHARYDWYRLEHPIIQLHTPHHRAPTVQEKGIPPCTAPSVSTVINQTDLLTSPLGRKRSFVLQISLTRIPWSYDSYKQKDEALHTMCIAWVARAVRVGGGPIPWSGRASFQTEL